MGANLKSKPNMAETAHLLSTTADQAYLERFQCSAVEAGSENLRSLILHALHVLHGE
jgi:hypothetical protein